MNKKNITILFSLVVAISLALGLGNQVFAAEDHNSSRSNLSNIYGNKAPEQKDVKQKSIRGIFRNIIPSKRKKERVGYDGGWVVKQSMERNMKKDEMEKLDNKRDLNKRKILGNKIDNRLDRRKKRDNEILDKRGIKREIERNRDKVSDKFHKNRGVLEERLRNATTSEERDAIIRKFKENKGELKDRIKNRIDKKRTNIRRKLNKRAAGRVKAYIKRITHRLNAVLNRLEKLADRIVSHLDKLSENGIDTVKAREHLIFAKQKVVKARDDVKKMEIAIENASDSENLHSAISEIRPLLKEAIVSVKEAHRALVNAIRAVRNNGKRDKQESSSTNNDTGAN